MKYAIKLTTYAADKTAEAVISKALGFEKEMSHNLIVDIFSGESKPIGGKFTSKKAASMTADRINKRGAFGGFEIGTFAEVVAA